MELVIEKLIYGGDGLARQSSALESKSKAIFVPYVLPAERVDARVVEERPGFARAHLERVLLPSKLRVDPPCRYFGGCGGCHYQHIAYHEQLRLKSDILRETLRRIAKIDLPLDVQMHPSPPLQYRNRTRFHLRHKPSFAIGYFRHASNELLPVRECPISSPLINRVLGQLWAAGERGGVPQALEEIELFANATDDQLLVELVLRTEPNPRDALQRFARSFADVLPEVLGVAGFALRQSGSRIRLQPRPKALFGEMALDYRVAGQSYRVSAGAFFQTNRYLVPRMVELIVGARSGRVALDLYSGGGLSAVPLAGKFDRVIAVESSPISAADLRANVPGNVKVSAQSSEEYLTSATNTLKADLVVADPPRAGLGEKVCRQIMKLSAKEVVYVSCDPATLARDLKQLTSAAWSISAMHLIDLFPQTFHIETCTVLRR